MYKPETDIVRVVTEFDDNGFNDDGPTEYIGIIAEATIRFRTEQGGWITGPTVRSPGVWCVDIASSNEHKLSLAKEELAELKLMVNSLCLGLDLDHVSYEGSGIDPVGPVYDVPPVEDNSPYPVVTCVSTPSTAAGSSPASDFFGSKFVVSGR